MQAHSLTQREQQILSLCTAGLCTKRIARALNLSPRTIEIHRGRIRTKLGVSSIMQAVLVAIEKGLVTQPDAVKHHWLPQELEAAAGKMGWVG